MITYTFQVSSHDKTNGWTTQTFENYVSGEKPFVGFSDVDARITGELNSGYLEFINNDIDNLPMFDIITITTTDDSTTPATTQVKSFYIGEDKTEILDKENGKVLHKVELIDLTKKLEKYTLETITFTNTSDESEDTTLLQGIYRLWSIAKLQKDVSVNSALLNTIQTNNYRNYYNLVGSFNTDIFNSIDVNEQVHLDSIKLPQMVLSNLTLREAINELLKVANAICYLDFDTTYHTFTLKFQYYNETKNLITNSNIESLSQEHSVDDYASGLDDFVSNQITENGGKNNLNVIYPNRVTSTTIRTNGNNYELTDNNFGILLPNEIYTLYDIVFDISYSIKVYGNSGESDYYYVQDQELYVNTKDYIVDQDQYASLSYSTLIGVREHELYTTNTIMWQYKSNFINLSNTYKGFAFTYYSSINAILMETYSRLIQTIRTNIPNHNVDIEVDGFGKVYVPMSGDTFTINQVTNGLADLYDKIKYKVSYLPIYNTRLKTQKNDTSEVKKQVSQFSNQRAKIISLQNIGVADKSQLERIGNQNYSTSLRHLTLDSLYHNGDYTQDGYIITKSEYIYYDDFIVGKYDLTKNYQKLSEYIGINSEYRAYEIPSGKNVYERNLHFNTYCYVGKNATLSTTNSVLTTDAMASAIGVLNNSNYTNTQIEGAVVSIDNLTNDWDNLVSTYNKMYLHATSDGSGDNIVITFSFDDNISAGYIVKVKYDNTLLKRLMQKVPYTKNGNFTSLSVNLIPNLEQFDGSNLPLIKDNLTSVANISNLLVMKDQSEIIKFTYQLSFINIAIGDLFIGKDFTKYNHLVSLLSSNIIKVYGSNEPYNASDNFVKGTEIGLASNLLNIVNSANHFNLYMPTLSNYNYSWYAIGNKEENIILMAMKKEQLASLDFWFSDERIDIDKTY